MTLPAQVGQFAPNFTAPAAFPGEAANSPLQTVSLADYAGRWLVFFWYPSDFTTVCPSEITALSDRMDEFTDLDTAILGASTDSVYCHRAWLRTPRMEKGIAESVSRCCLTRRAGSPATTASCWKMKGLPNAGCLLLTRTASFNTWSRTILTSGAR